MRYLVTVLLSIFSFYAHAQEDERVIKNIRTDFGALGDGVHNDHEAFKEASKFFNERGGNGTLIIPAGTYLVGRQLEYGALVPIIYQPFAEGQATNPFYKLGVPVMVISGCKYFTIEGQGSPVIRFADDMVFGGFYADGKPMPLKDKQGNAVVPAQNSIAFVGDGIYIENSKNIIIKGIELDGNSPGHIVGGNISADGWQWGQSGIILEQVKKITIDNIKVHHFAVDGLQLRNSTSPDMDSIRSHNIMLRHSSFDYNGRQGFSWTGGAGVTAINCSFSNTGMAYNGSLKARLSTSPGAGMDIEPESDPHIGIYRLVKEGAFTQCKFENNTGVSMVADIYDEQAGRVAQDIVFNDCTFWAGDSWSVWVSHPGFTFSDCKIYGSVVHSYSGKKLGKETRFISSHFEDKAYPGRTGKTHTLMGNYLVEIADGIGTTFEQCTFTAHKKRFYYLTSSEPNNEAGKFVVRDCKFINASGTAAPKNVMAEGVLFKGRNEHIDLPAR